MVCYLGLFNNIQQSYQYSFCNDLFLNFRVIWYVNQIVLFNGFLSDFVDITSFVYTKTIILFNLGEIVVCKIIIRCISQIWPEMSAPTRVNIWSMLRLHRHSMISKSYMRIVSVLFVFILFVFILFWKIMKLWSEL